MTSASSLARRRSIRAIGKDIFDCQNFINREVSCSHTTIKMVTLTHFGRFALLATITRLATSLPQAPLEQQPKPDGPLQLGKSGFEIVG